MPSELPVVVVETEDGAEAVSLWHALSGHGYRVEWCPGPNESLHRRCLLAATGRCPLVDRADVVLSHLDFAREDARDCLTALEHFHPETPVVVSARDSVIAEFPEIATGRRAVAYPRAGVELVAAVGEFVTRSD